MMKTKIAHAVAMTLAGGALSLGAVSNAAAVSYTSYNTAIRTGVVSSDPLNANYNVPNRVGGTDGWVYNSTGGSGNTNYPNVYGFVGVNGTNSVTQTTPFGYAGTSHLNWGAYIDQAGDSLTISKADALTNYSAVSDVEIDTGAGAWQDSTGTGWKHQTDIGLIKTNEDMWITLNPTVVSDTGFDIQNFGITVFSGMDDNTGAYSHHGRWNCPTCTSTNYKPYDLNNPFGTTSVTYLTHDATVDGTNGLSFLAQAGQIYSIYLGGAGVGSWSKNVADYSLSIQTAPVPVPAAAWLFGGALMSLFGANRRKKVLPA